MMRRALLELPGRILSPLRLDEPTHQTPGIDFLHNSPQQTMKQGVDKISDLSESNEEQTTYAASSSEPSKCDVSSSILSVGAGFVQHSPHFQQAVLDERRHLQQL